MTDRDDMTRELHEMLLNALQPIDLEAERREAIKQRLLERVAAAGAMAPLVTIRSDEGEWHPVLPKVSMKVLLRARDSLTYLLRLEPGAKFPPHDHPQTEECIVLEGEARIGDLVVRAGDYHAATAGCPHGLLASERGALLFLRGAVPSAKHVHWTSKDTYAALIAGALGKMADRRST